MRTCAVLGLIVVPSLVACGGFLASTSSDQTDAGSDADDGGGGSPDATVGDGAAADAAGGDAGKSDPTAATSYLLNPAHTSSIHDPTLAPPLALSWTHDFGSPWTVSSHPLIAGGDVYLLLENESGGTGGAVQLVALDETTGAAAWGPFAVPMALLGSEHTYDRGRVFVAYQGVDLACHVSSYDGATGHPTWTTALPGSCLTPLPTAYGGVVYVNDDETVLAVDEASGNVLWSAGAQMSDDAPAVTDDGVFVGVGCGGQYAFDRFTGSLLWQAPSSCDGISNDPSVISGGRDYVFDFRDGNVVYDAKTGGKLGTFPGDRYPAVDGSIAVFSPPGSIAAADATTGQPLWTFAGDGALNGTPVIAGGAVYVGSTNGMLFGVDETSGAPLWSELYSPVTTPILAAGQGRLLVWSESSSSITAYARVADAGTVPSGASNCTAPFGRCGTTCVDLQNDPQNCGACGATCTGTCAGGTCTAPVVLAAHEDPVSIALDPDYVYWVNYSAGEVRRVAKTGGQPEMLNSSPSTYPLSVAVDQSNVYWTVPNYYTNGADASVMEQPLDGGAAIALGTGLVYPTYIAVSPTTVFWTVDGPPDTVMTVPIDGGTVAPFATGQGSGEAIAIDSHNLYWSTNGGTYQAPLGGGQPVSIGPGAGALAVDDTYVYLAVNGMPTGSIVRVPIGGGAPATLADSRPRSLTAIAVDDTRVYWIEGSGTIGMGSLEVMDKSGGTPRVLVSGLQDPSALAVDGSYVYFANTVAGEVEKIAK